MQQKPEAIPDLKWWQKVLLFGAAGGFLLSMLVNIATRLSMAWSYAIGFGIAGIVVAAIFIVYHLGKRPRRTRRHHSPY